MKARPRWQRGLTLLEFTLIAIVISVLVAFALDRIAGVRVQMERAAIEYSVARMREALAVRFAELVVRRRLDELPALAGANPLAWPDVVGDYAGVEALPPPARRQPGRWYYVRGLGQVIYVPRNPEALDWPAGEPRVLRWRARPEWVDADGDGRYEPAVDRVGGMALVRLDGARWR